MPDGGTRLGLFTPSLARALPDSYCPSLDLLRQVVHPAIWQVAADPIKKSSTPAAVYRLYLRAEPQSALPHTLVAKRTAPDWPDDPLGHEREIRFYAEILPLLDIPQPVIYFAGREPGTDHHLVIMQDVAATHRFPKPDHCWTMAEIRPVLQVYARLHLHGRTVVPTPDERAWLMPRHEQRVRAQFESLPRMAQELAAMDVWPTLPDLERLATWLAEQMDNYAGQPVTLLHNDVFPPNAALPTAAGDVLLFDWEMLGWGLAEMDLAFMFFQPFGSDHALDKFASLDYYWTERERLSGALVAGDKRQARQFYADTLWAFWLLPVAHRMAQRPFPPGTFPRRYWDAMLPLIGRRLQALCRTQPRN